MQHLLYPHICLTRQQGSIKTTSLGTCKEASGASSSSPCGQLMNWPCSMQHEESPLEFSKVKSACIQHLTSKKAWCSNNLLFCQAPANISYSWMFLSRETFDFMMPFVGQVAKKITASLCGGSSIGKKHLDLGTRSAPVRGLWHTADGNNTQGANCSHDRSHNFMQ